MEGQVSLVTNVLLGFLIQFELVMDEVHDFARNGWICLIPRPLIGVTLRFEVHAFLKVSGQLHPHCATCFTGEFTCTHLTEDLIHHAANVRQVSFKGEFHVLLFQR
ncbi:hypothetical protein D3C85_225530 [compost metagenome]